MLRPSVKRPCLWAVIIICECTCFGVSVWEYGSLGVIVMNVGVVASK